MVSGWSLWLAGCVLHFAAAFDVCFPVHAHVQRGGEEEKVEAGRGMHSQGPGST